jgi:hypothetical protein
VSRIFRTLVVSRIFRTFNLAERHPALGHAVMAPLICWSFSNPNCESALKQAVSGFGLSSSVSMKCHC